ncbi:MAG: ATP-binding protein [Egibacteraceae bacterium]
MNATPDGSRVHALLRSIRVRILTAFVVLLALAALGGTVLDRQVLYRQLDEEIRTDLRQEVGEFKRLAGGVDPSTGEPFGADLRAIFDVYFDREIPDEGETILAFVDGELVGSARAQDAAESTELAPTVDYWLSLTEQEAGAIDTPAGRARYVALPLDGGDSEGVFVVANFPAFEQAEIDEAIQAQTAIHLAMLVVASLLAAVLAGRILRPLRSLAATARAISVSDLTGRIPVRGSDEASEIGRAFNEMVGRLEQAFATQQRFLDEAGHELRAPLTVIRGNIELLEDDPVERRKTVELVLDEIDRMNRIVNDLLLLAQAERPDFVRFEPVEFALLTEEIFRKASGLAPRRWQLEACGRGTVDADRQRLTQAVMQLAQNACQQTSEGGSVRVGSALWSQTAELWVHDDGPGVSPEDAERIFQRFARGRRRSSHSGAGLGLSIVVAIAEAHGGTVELDHLVEDGARFRIAFPAASQELPVPG